MNRLLICLVATALLQPALAVAAEPEPVSSIEARWVEAGHVELRVSWQGGACEQPGEASVHASQADETVDAVTIPTVATAEVCTMQIVTVEFTGVVAVEPLTESLAVTVLAPDGQPRATGFVAIAAAD